MSSITSTLSPILPALDPEVGAALGDEILLGTARADKVAKVAGESRGGRGNTVQSHTARAWSTGGQVD